MSMMNAEFDQLMLEIERSVLESLDHAALQLQCPECGQELAVPLTELGDGGSVTCGCGTRVNLNQT